MNQKHKNLQEKYLKISNELRKKPQEELYLKSKKMKEQKIQLRNSFSSISNRIKAQKNIYNTLPKIKSFSKDEEFFKNINDNIKDNNEKKESEN